MNFAPPLKRSFSLFRSAYSACAAISVILATGIARADDAAAIAALENSGAIVKRDDSQDGKPVVQVTCNLREITPECNRALKEIENLPSIELLGAGGSEVSVGTMRALQGKRSLKRFSIAFAKLGDECARVLGTLKSLEALELRAQTDMSPKGISEIQHLGNLRELTLSDRLVNDEVLAELPKFPQLSVVNLRSVFITDAGVKSLRRCKHLTRVALFLGSNVTEEGLHQLAEINLKQLDLIFADVDDNKLKELRKLSGLKSLRLINAAKVTDDGIPYLVELTDLKDLDLANATLTKSGIQQLKRSLPNCTVVIENRQRN